MAGIFGLNRVYKKQVKNINDNNFDSWPESAAYGYFGGGYTPPRVDTVDRIDFSNETTSAPGYNLTQGRFNLAACSSSSYGYFACGQNPPLEPDYVATVDRIDFSNETTSAPGYDLTQGRTGLAAVSSSSYGYFGGGRSPSFVATIDRIDFSNETTFAPGYDLTQARVGLAAVSSSSYGYFGGGDAPPIVATIDRIDFSNETTSPVTDTLTQGRNTLAAVSSNSYGYFGGGRTSPSPSNYVATIDRIDFSNETTSAPGYNLTQARGFISACSNSSYGYFGGGQNPPLTPDYRDTVDRIDFSNETTTAPGYDLTQARSALAATSGGQSQIQKGSRTYGYFGGGYTQNQSPRYVATIDRIDFSNETTSPVTDNLTQARYGLAATSSSSHGYFGGGNSSFSPPIVATVDRIDFSNETTSAPGNNLPQARYYLAACSSSFYGYFGGGWYDEGPPAGTYVATVDRIDFSNDTTSVPGYNLPEARGRLSACSSSSYGYFGGGLDGPPSTNYVATIDRIDFLNETTFAPGYNLTQGRLHLAACSSGSYGYFVSGLNFSDPELPPPINYVATIDRIDFSNETTSAPGNNLPQERQDLAGCSSGSYGYFAGGFGPPGSTYHVLIDRIDFSNETTSAPGYNLTQGRSTLAATSN